MRGMAGQRRPSLKGISPQQIFSPYLLVQNSSQGFKLLPLPPSCSYALLRTTAGDEDSRSPPSGLSNAGKVCDKTAAPAPSLATAATDSTQNKSPVLLISLLHLRP